MFASNIKKVGGIVLCAIVLAFAIVGLSHSASCVDGNPVVSLGSSAQCGNSGPAVPVTMGTPNTRTLSLATAYQATDPTKIAIVTVNITSTATISLTSGATNTADILIGSTNGVASGTGSSLCKYTNSNTGALTIGLNLSTVMTTSCTLNLPVGWYFAVRQTAGTVSIQSAFDQSVG